jgi:hypothetical protein
MTVFLAISAIWLGCASLFSFIADEPLIGTGYGVAALACIAGAV